MEVPKKKKGKEKPEKRFEVVSAESMSLMWEASVIRDKQTGVHYFFVAHSYGGGLTPLLDKDGQLIIS